jgi:hypothetical protein
MRKFNDWEIEVKKSTIMSTEEMENFQKRYKMPTLPEVGPLLPGVLWWGFWVVLISSLLLDDSRAVGGALRTREESRRD